MVKTTKEYNADYLLFSAGLTLRDLQARWFLNHIQKRYPRLITKYEDLYDFKYSDDSYAGNYNLKSAYSNSINQLLFNLCNEYNVNYRMKRFIPDDFRKVNYTIAEKFLNTSYKRQICGGNWKTIFWAGQAIQNLRESVVHIASRDELLSIKNVNKPIEDYLKQYIEGLNE